MRQLTIFFETSKGKRVKNMIIGLGAAVVMMGALFKLESWPFASAMLIAGLSVEAFIFALQGLLPPHKDYYWEKLYPDLDVSPEEEEAKKGGHAEAKSFKSKSITEELDSVLEKAKIESELLERLGANLGKLGTNIEKLNDIGDAGVATQEYSENARQASKALTEMKNAYMNATEAVSGLASMTTETKSYQEEVGKVSKNLSALNAMYEMELQDTGNHLKTMKDFSTSLSSALSNLNESVEDTKTYKTEMQNLSKNLSSLNQVYGNMLGAMTMGRPGGTN
jgi:gliding motility-associated protein GldL